MWGSPLANPNPNPNPNSDSQVVLQNVVIAVLLDKFTDTGSMLDEDEQLAKDLKELRAFALGE